MRKRIGRFWPAAGLLAFALLFGTTDGQSASLAGWMKIVSTGGRCAHGDRFAFWFHPGSSSRLVVYFQGGGGCWDFDTCRSGSSFYVSHLQAPTAQPMPDNGIIDLANPANPFRGDAIVYVPYCTGDVHWGNNVQTYRDGHGHRLVIHHVGFDNDRRVLQWVYRRYPSPDNVFVTGCSAGSVGSAVFAPYLIRHYPHATVSQLGDSLALVLPRPLDIRTGWRADRNLPAWIPALLRLDPGRMTMAAYYSAVASYYRDHTFAQFDYTRDATQTRYYVALGGKARDFPVGLARSLKTVTASAPNFRVYVAPGQSHCVLPNAAFYSLGVPGRPLRQWVADLAVGTPVPSVTPKGW